MPEGFVSPCLRPPLPTDYKPEGCAQAAHATKHMYLYRLPLVLVLHLKRFQYTGNNIVKNHK